MELYTLVVPQGLEYPRTFTIDRRSNPFMTRKQYKPLKGQPAYLQYRRRLKYIIIGLQW